MISKQVDSLSIDSNKVSDLLFLFLYNKSGPKICKVNGSQWTVETIGASHTGQQVVTFHSLNHPKICTQLLPPCLKWVSRLTVYQWSYSCSRFADMVFDKLDDFIWKIITLPFLWDIFLLVAILAIGMRSQSFWLEFCKAVIEKMGWNVSWNKNKDDEYVQ